MGLLLTGVPMYRITLPSLPLKMDLVTVPMIMAKHLMQATYYLTGNNFNVSGVISTNSDKDAFKFTLNTNANFHLTAIPFNVQGNWIGANLDIRIELYNSSSNVDP